MKLKHVLSLALVLISIVVFLPLATIKTEAATALYWPVPGHFSLSRGYTSTHDAMDINDSNIAGANIVAAIGGTVYRVKTCTTQHYGDSSCSCGGTGTGLVIKGTDGRYYSYAHMQAGSIPTKFRTVGAKISSGEVIGKVGTTGNSSGNHLHFSIAKTKTWWENGLDPEKETYTYSGGTAFSITQKTDKVSVSDTDAVIAVDLKKPSKNKVITYAATIYENGKALGTKSEASGGWSGTTNPWFSWSASKMGINLNPGTEYQYTFTINVSGVSITSPIYTFKTTGVDKTLQWPVAGHTTVSQKYSSTHDAIDISDSTINGANITAAMGGTVYRISNCTSQHYGDSSCSCAGTGTGVVIKGNDGRYYSYAHMQAGSIPANFVVGTKVSKGDIIGKVGTTGNSSGPHLHFSIALTSAWWENGVDPQKENYIYAEVNEPDPVTFTFSQYNKTVSGTNTDVDAVIGVTIKKASSAKVITYAATVYENGKAIGSISDTSSGWVGETDPKFWWSVSAMGITLKPGTNYQYTFTINVDGVTKTSPKYDFKTTGTISHTWDNGSITKAATCKETGVMTFTCTTCSATKTEVIPQTNNHSFSQWTKENDATHKRTCSVCSKEETTSHSWNSGQITKQPTCKETGVKTYTCSVCGGTKTESVEKLTNHTYDNGCDTSCNVCGKTRIANHQYNTTWSCDATNHWYECSLCGDEKEVSAHTPGAAATETTAQKCTVCNYVITPALGHTHSYKAEWSTNVKNHWHDCTGCGEQKDKAPHVYTNACDTTCNTCVYTRTVTHSYKTEWSSSADGHWYECSVCGERAGVTAHVYGEWTVTKEATATVDGEKERTCVCGIKQTETVPATGASSGDKSDITTGEVTTGEVTTGETTTDEVTTGELTTDTTAQKVIMPNGCKTSVCVTLIPALVVLGACLIKRKE